MSSHITSVLDQCIAASALQRDLGEGDCFSTLVTLIHQYTPPSLIAESITSDATNIVNTINVMFNEDF